MIILAVLAGTGLLVTGCVERRMSSSRLNVYDTMKNWWRAREQFGSSALSSFVTWVQVPTSALLGCIGSDEGLCHMRRRLSFISRLIFNSNFGSGSNFDFEASPETLLGYIGSTNGYVWKYYASRAPHAFYGINVICLTRLLPREMIHMVTRRTTFFLQNYFFK